MQEDELKAEARQEAFNRYSDLAQTALKEWLGGSYASREIHVWCQGYAAALQVETQEPTEAMIEAGEAAWRAGDEPDTDMCPDVRAIYTAMRSTAPDQLDHSSHVEAARSRIKQWLQGKRSDESLTNQQESDLWELVLAASPRHVDASTKEGSSSLVEALERAAAKTRTLARNILDDVGPGTCDGWVSALNAISRSIEVDLAKHGSSSHE